MLHFFVKCTFGGLNFLLRVVIMNNYCKTLCPVVQFLLSKYPFRLLWQGNTQFFIEFYMNLLCV